MLKGIFSIEAKSDPIRSGLRTVLGVQNRSLYSILYFFIFLSFWWVKRFENKLTGDNAHLRLIDADADTRPQQC